MALRKGSHPRHKIKQLSTRLRKLTFPSSPIPIELARFAADAFDAYLSGKAQTLDAAFGVGTVRGAPRTLSKAKQRYALARKIYALRLAGRSWYEVENELRQDQGSLRRLYKDFKVPLLSRGIAQKLLRSAPTTPTTHKS